MRMREGGGRRGGSHGGDGDPARAPGGGSDADPACDLPDVSAPAASVVVTSYNTPTGLLAISLSSILGQTMEDLELVLVVDGDLTPDSAELVESLRRADERLVVFQPGRVGRAQALNLGLDAARSPLI